MVAERNGLHDSRGVGEGPSALGPPSLYIYRPHYKAGFLTSNNPTTYSPRVLKIFGAPFFTYLYKNPAC